MQLPNLSWFFYRLVVKEVKWGVGAWAGTGAGDAKEHTLLGAIERGRAGNGDPEVP